MCTGVCCNMRDRHSTLYTPQGDGEADVNVERVAVIAIFPFILVQLFAGSCAVRCGATVR